MVSKCGYCKIALTDDRAIEVCDKCGEGIWGAKMFNAIKTQMDGAKVKGDLFQGSVSDSP